MIPDFVQDLIERKQLIEAVRLICGFNLSARFLSVPLLKEYVEGARQSYCTKWLNEVEDNQIGDLNAAIHCIKDNHLESEFLYKDIEKEIVEQVLWGDSSEPAPLEPAAKPIVEKVPRHFGF
ncbi:hypothetical protein C1H46_030080 [Malus baccata]|uniref:FRIGIDA-like protein n=1 Tax=Malus baccata TaxID=106549 RepID=A0A540LD30_MALBA|nr:hypothetical protein C1H46_030080 [Malus baccata]